MDMTWFFELRESLDAMSEEDRDREYSIYNKCPWCRLALEHTKEEHYSIKPKEAPNATVH